jgi:hypothetical protein
MSRSMVCHDLYLRHTDKEGNTVIVEHRVWDSELFIAAQQAAAAKEGGKSAVEVVTRDDYLATRAKRQAA